MERPRRGQRSEEKISKNVDFSLWGNRATTQNTFFDIFKSTKNALWGKKVRPKSWKSRIVSGWLLFVLQLYCPFSKKKMSVFCAKIRVFYCRWLTERTDAFKGRLYRYFILWHQMMHDDTHNNLCLVTSSFGQFW